MPTNVRAKCASTVSVAAAVLLAMTALAPAAEAAQTEQQIKAGCDEAGGTYTHTAGSRISKCCYKDYYGDTYCDEYIDGVYIGDDGPEKAPPVPGPNQPPSNNAPIGPPPPAAH
jgi:hypothetical protein